jgi:alkaline phosphatase D
MAFKQQIFVLSLYLIYLLPAQADQSVDLTPNKNTIAFGSCLRQWQPQPVWQAISELSPKAFIFLGDNMYSDTGKYVSQAEPQRIQTAYSDLAATETFKTFLSNAKTQGTDLYATWDDHDYGSNDGGSDYPHKLAAKGYFLDFFKLENTATGGRENPGIYQSHRLNVADLDVQLLLMDTRSFRSPLKKDPNSQQCPGTKNVANTDADATVLGAQQWHWLEQQLHQPADLRLIASSIQVVPEQHCYEKWANFPQQRQQLFDLIKKTQADGVVFISGDRHLAEISKLSESEAGYPLYEVTSSGLNSAMGNNESFAGEHNNHRLNDIVFSDNFGAISIQEGSEGKRLVFQIYKASGHLAERVIVPLDELSF